MLTEKEWYVIMKLQITFIGTDIQKLATRIQIDTNIQINQFRICISVKNLYFVAGYA